MNDDVERGCLLPIVQGGAAFILGFALAYGLARWQAWTDPGWIALSVGAAGALLTWASGVINWRRHVYGEPEPIYRPAPPVSPITPQKVRVELAKDNGRHLDLIDLPADSERLQALAHGLLNGSTLSEATWTGAHGLFSRSEFAQLKSEMIRRGLARWNNPTTPARGAALTPAGRAVMREFSINADISPTPRGDDDQNVF